MANKCHGSAACYARWIQIRQCVLIELRHVLGRHAPGAYTIFDGLVIDGTYPGHGTMWCAGISMGGTGDVARHNMVHDVAYTARASHACGNGGAGISGTGY